MPVAKSGNKRKITIKAFAKPPKLPPDFYDKTSRDLLEATSFLLAGSSSSISSGKSKPNLQHSYNMVTSLVSHQFGPRLYQDLVKELQASAKAVLPEQAGRASSDLLPFLAQQYPKYVDYLLLVRHIFMGLDRPYVWEDGAVAKRTCQSTTLLEVGLQQFHALLRDMGWEDDAYDAWWHLFWDKSFAKHNGDGNAGETSSSLSLLASTMNMWKDLGLSRSMIQRTQPLFQRSLKQLSTMWQTGSSIGSGEYSPQAFLMYVYQQWQYVSQHCSTFLPKTWLRSLVEMNLLEPHLNDQYLLKELDITNLQHCQRLWYLAARIDGGLQRVLQAVCALVKKQGLVCIQLDLQQQQPPPLQQPKIIISSLLQLYAQLQALQKTVGDIPLKQVWSEVLNSTPLVAEWLAKYIDMEFKNYNTTKGGASETSLTSAGNNNNLEPLLHLFTHLQAKDVFEAFYKKDLAKRLLLGRIQNMDLERQFVSLLKTECGAGYTSKMEGMFQDMEWSRESLARYKDSAEYKETTVDMEVQILTTGYWPVYAQYKTLVLPDELTNPQKHFWGHYKQKYQGRKIVWQYALGNCHVKYFSMSKTYELVVSLCQTLVLQCFNERDQWTPPELRQRIGLDDREEMERTLMSMALGKEQHRILIRKKGPPSATADGPPAPKPSGKFISDEDTFCINEKFSSNMRRIKIPNMLKKETKEERDKVVEAVSRDRLYLIDAVLVRVMKARKTILHQQLIPQVLEQVKVPAQPSDIKKRIESLIEREYMERDEKEHSRYNYLA